MPNEVAEWKKWVDVWEKAQHVENEKNSPYKYKEESESIDFALGWVADCGQQQPSRTYV
jgi:hypothetical protein